MNIVLKNSLKNIIGKPFRTLLVTFTIFMCSISALLSFDMGSLIPRVVEAFYGSVSRADIMVYSDGRDLTELPEGFPESDRLNISNNTEILYKDIEGEYAYVTTDHLSIYGMDMDEAVDMEFIGRRDLHYERSCGRLRLQRRRYIHRTRQSSERDGAHYRGNILGGYQ